MKRYIIPILVALLIGVLGLNLNADQIPRLEGEESIFLFEKMDNYITMGETPPLNGRIIKVAWVFEKVPTDTVVFVVLAQKQVGGPMDALGTIAVLPDDNYMAQIERGILIKEKIIVAGSENMPTGTKFFIYFKHTVLYES